MKPENQRLLERERYLWRIQLQGAVDTRSHAWQNDTGISFKALCPAINEWDDRAGIQDSIFIAQEGDLERSNQS